MPLAWEYVLEYVFLETKQFCAAIFKMNYEIIFNILLLSSLTVLAH